MLKNVTEMDTTQTNHASVWQLFLCIYYEHHLHDTTVLCSQLAQHTLPCCLTAESKQHRVYLDIELNAMFSVYNRNKKIH